MAKDLMRCNSDVSENNLFIFFSSSFFTRQHFVHHMIENNWQQGHVETREPELKRDSRSWTQTIRKTSKTLGKTFVKVALFLFLFNLIFL